MHPSLPMRCIKYIRGDLNEKQILIGLHSHLAMRPLFRYNLRICGNLWKFCI